MMMGKLWMDYMFLLRFGFFFYEMLKNEIGLDVLNLYL